MKALALFSGGLDSILAYKVVERQGIDVEALHFTSPFFGRRDELGAYRDDVWRRYGISLSVIDVGNEFLGVLRNPQHGYGRCFNPCIDCKILLLRRAKSELDERGASFLVSGEVLGQRPMSQRGDALRLVEKRSSTTGILLRPLSALRLPATRMEEDGVIDRTALFGIQGRSRKEQMVLADRFGVTDYPSPSGGCILTDRVVSQRVRRLFELVEISDNSCRLMQIGRHFLLPGGGWLVLGRNATENRIIQDLSQADDVVVRTMDAPGPTGLLRGATFSATHHLAAGVVAGFSRSPGTEPARLSLCAGGSPREIVALPISSEQARSYRL